eukprot:CAMPEP_0170541956 /NCGR_PEP_ID=MMETSP0211-20121228/1538_1 /TAXON_ID=311385 /ORGANISM="Pseudokeronopsis sp., Strain OXSARD2" /LENGTH=250 /DNA_ID=CAMNT_0010844871 /DNA_START=701 /DNA_END=1453 /DNA_ORIENTATION=-
MNTDNNFQVINNALIEFYNNEFEIAMPSPALPSPERNYHQHSSRKLNKDLLVESFHKIGEEDEDLSDDENERERKGITLKIENLNPTLEEMQIDPDFLDPTKKLQRKGMVIPNRQGTLKRQESIIATKKIPRQSDKNEGSKLAYSSDKANLLNLKKDQLKQYMSQKRFNHEDKEVIIQNLQMELLYSLTVAFDLKEIAEFIINLQGQKELGDFFLQIRLKLHKLLNCQACFLFKVQNLNTGNDLDLYLEA